MLLPIEKDYDRIVNLGQSILTLHQEREWKHKTRSNFSHQRLESVYLAAEELEFALISWKRIAETEFIEDNDRVPPDNNEKVKLCLNLRNAKKNYYKIFKQSETVMDCINALKSLKLVARNVFIQPLLKVFPENIPIEVSTLRTFNEYLIILLDKNNI